MPHLASIHNENREIPTICIPKSYEVVATPDFWMTFSITCTANMQKQLLVTHSSCGFNSFLFSVFVFNRQAKAMMKTKMVKRIDSKQRETTYTGQCHSANVLQYYWSMRLLQALSRIREF